MSRSTDRVLDVLETVCLADGPLDLREVGALVELPSSSAHRFLQALVARGYLRQDGATHKYRPGLKLLELSHEVISRNRLVEVTRHPLRRFVDVLEETAHLAVLDNDEVIYLLKFHSVQPLELYSRIGRRAPAYCTGVGKVLLAFQPEAFVAQYLSTSTRKSFTANTITDSVLLGQELRRVRSRGYAVDAMEHEPGIQCIACPIFGPEGEVFAAISGTAPAVRLPMERLMHFLPDLQATALTISL